MRCSRIVINEFHTHPNANSGCGHQLTSIARAKPALISGTPYRTAKETIIDRFPQLLADLARGTGIESTENLKNTTAETRRKIVEVGNIYTTSLKQFEREFDSKKDIKQPERKLALLNAQASIIRQLKTGEQFDSRISQADRPKAVTLETALSNEARLKIIGQLVGDQNNT